MTGSVSWILVRFLSGQSIVQLMNACTGIAIVWLLPVEEYALYVLAMLFFTVAPIIINMGISQSVTTFGSKRDERSYLGALLSTGEQLSWKFYWVVIAGMLLMAWSIFSNNESWSTGSAVIAMAMVVPACWLQNKVTMRQALLNLCHDDKGLFVSGATGAGVRLLLLAPCVIWPEATVALVGNLAAVVAMHVVLGRYGRNIAQFDEDADEAIRQSIVKFIMPLALIIIYFAFQNQISLLILSHFGYTELIAQVGALGRLGQIIAMLMMLNPFYIQPYFARIEQRKQFVSRLGLVVGLLSLLTVVLVATAMLYPSPWLYILGGNYSGLSNELPVAVASALFALIGGTFYTIVLARAETASQYWGVVFGVSAQAIYILAFGVTTTIDALYLNMLPAIAYTMVQVLILIRIINRWQDV